MLKSLFFIVFVAVSVIVLAVFVALNTEPVTYDYFLGKIELQSWMPFVAGLLVGIVGMMLFFVTSGYLWKVKARSLESQLHNLHKDQQKKAIKAEFDEIKNASTAS